MRKVWCFSHLVGLKTQSRARQNVRRGLYSARAQNAVVEPKLVQCSVCMEQFSSQHVLRNVLLQKRPLHWPPWEHALAKREIGAKANHEVVCRNTLSQAIDIVNERERVQMDLRSECTGLTDKWG
jgi:hypothetical protein